MLRTRCLCMTCPACGAGTSEGHSTCPSCGRRLKVPREVATGLLTPVPKTTDPGTTILPPSESATNAGIASSDPDATRIGSPVSRPLESEDVTRLGTEQQGFDTGVTRLGTPDEDDVTRVGTGPEEFDADVTQLGTPPEDVTRIAAPEDDATQYVPSEEDLTVYVAPEDDATFVGTARPEDDATYIAPPRPPTNRPPTARPATTPSRPPTSQVRPPSTLRRPPSTGGLRSKSGVRASGKDGPLEVGQAFGERYQILKVLGVGGMGAVYQAFDQELGVAVALKVIRPEIAADPRAADEIERRFKRELLLARQVTHKNVVRIHDLGDIDGIKYITMPYIHGSDLATILSENKNLTVQRALRIARGIVSGLVAAHGAGVVHRDLKPANIMVSNDDEPTIMDFGIARSAGGPGSGPAPKRDIVPAELSRTSALLASQTMAGAIVGTVEYMAPEQAKGEAADQRADVYAFGLILYDMLIGGRRSKRAASAVAELQSRMEKAPPAPQSMNVAVPVAIEEILSRCLEPDPNKRFTTTLELQAALDRLDENGNPLPIYRRVRPRTMVAAALLVLLLLAGTFYGAKWVMTPPKEHEPVAVVIADFQNDTGDPTFDRSLEPTVKRALEGAGFISAHDRTGMRTSLGVRPPDRLDEAAARDIALKQGLGVVLSGSIRRQGSRYEVSVKTIQTVTGATLTDVSGRASSKDEVVDAATRLVASVRRGLGDEMSNSAQLLALKSLSSTSLDVVRLYAAALEAQYDGKYDEARQSYSRAVELDPKFGLGYAGLGHMSRNLGNLADAEKYMKQALSHLEGVTERERFAIRGSYYIVTGDYRQCVQELGEAIAKFPADAVALNNRALCFSRVRNMREAVDAMSSAVRILPNRVALRGNLAVYADYAGDFATAEEQVKTVQEPNDMLTLAGAFAQLGQGRLAEAKTSYQNLANVSARGASWSVAGLGDLAMYEGRFADAVEIFRQGAAADLEAKNPDRAARKLTSLAYAQLLRGQKALAVATAEKALATSTTVPIRFLAARILVEGDALARARKIATELASELAIEAQAYGKIIEGELALKSGDPRQSIRILTDANDLLDTWLAHLALGRAYLQMKVFLQADSEFDRCVQRRGEALSLLVDEQPTAGYFPLALYHLAVAREGLNDPGFRKAYEEYLSIRGNSSEDSLVPQIRKRLGAS
jgi:serine/threonine protein kinase/tetratricopeptide (TPR) repeat protein